jgi:hypothetical protein
MKRFVRLLSLGRAAQLGPAPGARNACNTPRASCNSADKGAAQATSVQHLCNPQKETAMKHKVLAVAVASLFSLPAFADGEIGFEYWKTPIIESSKTRAEVVAELIAWQRSGDYFIAQTGLKGYQMWPSFYPQSAPVVAGKTRDEVIAEVAEAKRTGDFVVDGELGLTAKQLFPSAYPKQMVASGEQKRRM